MPQPVTTTFHIDTLAIEGGLFTAEWLGKVAAQQAGAQTDADYGVRAGFNLREEIALAWRSAQALWSRFDAARKLPGQDAWGTTQRFVVDLLRQSFAFQLAPATTPRRFAERIYPVAFSALGGRVPLVLSPHDEGKPLDTAHERLGDASGERGERVRRRSAFGLLQEVLNAQPDALWGLACNGLLLRLARDNASLTRPAWLEVDLERLFTEERFADFSVLWMLLHASRFGSESAEPTDCALEQWRNACREQGTRARETLRVGVEQALLMLGQGFVAHPANTALREVLASGTVTAHDYYRELLRLVYRLIFLLTVEERALLHPAGADAAAVALYEQGYGCKRLRERAARRSAHDRHTDLWQGLTQVWRALAAGEPLLALPALGGLFEPTQCPNLDAALIENRHLLAALWHLAWLREAGSGVPVRVNWRDMGPEELGSIYESLLELMPQLSDGHRAFGFQTGSATRGNARKTTGSYYTPDALVQQLLDSALEPVVAQALAAHPAGDAAAQALLGISVVDPACGSGHFLLAAARRIASHLARVRAEARDAVAGPPTPDDYRRALRDVVTHCIYGVDMNPMALELARMALWLESAMPEAPLGFVDHHLQLGNALLGVMGVRTLLQGIPDEAYTALTGDDKERCKALKKENRAERARLEKLLKSPQGLDLGPSVAEVAQPLIEIEALPDDTLEAIDAKRRRYQALGSGALDELARRRRLKTACDLYASAFLVRKAGEQVVPTTQHVVNALLGQPVSPALLMAATWVANTVPLLHWPIAFAPVFACGGFSVVLGNPPWDQSQFNDIEFFASRKPSIAALAGDARKRAIAALEEGEPRLWAELQAVTREVEAQNSFFRDSARYPLTAIGKLNTYPLFAETALRAIRTDGRAGVVLPSGIATDDSTSTFFAHISDGRLVRLIDFENSAPIFPGVHRSYKFCLLTIGPAAETQFAFFLANTGELADARRSFTLSADDIRRLNPNTRTCPVFRSQRDAAITKDTYARVPVLWDERRPDGNLWGITFRQGLFNMTSESGLFRDARRRRELSDPVPLYEAKMVHQFDHRWATYIGDGEETADLADIDKADASRAVQPRYWVEREVVEQAFDERGWSKRWVLGYRRNARNNDERTTIFALMPRVGFGDSLFLTLFSGARVGAIVGCLAAFNSLPQDYFARQKVGGINFSFYFAKQLVLPPPSAYDNATLHRVVPRALELCYVANDLQPFYADVTEENPAWDPRTGSERGHPWRWNPERRALLRAELDAIYARLYGLTRDELRFVLDPEDAMGPGYPSETFRVLKEREQRQFGEYRTQRLVLAAWDRLEQGEL
ncbi:MAG: N-6 DNA methylase [Burkholderiaceae bacterium]|nr:N-6 DNA methylase [Burkholderiaceae bacterium]